ncbi:sensor histidine kinase [Actinomadura flavalba]|uniref:sensor histidine kinase n=1 Tax=Actinomadura flavalba TaxID=1120938 RepID=UPI0003767F55|nr:histidine kinase [Actinomadura flavalba]
MRLRRSAREWRDDAVLFAVTAALGGVLLLGSLEDYPESKPAGVVRDIVIGSVAAVALLVFRRTRPLAVALAASAAALISSTALGVMAVAAYNLAARRTWRPLAVVVALNLAYIAAIFAFGPAQSTRERWEGVLVLGMGYLIIVGCGLLVRSRRQLIASLEERARQAEEGQRLRVEEARLLERERIAREMHDVLGHRISLLAVHAGALEFRPDAPPDQREAAGIVRQNAYEAMEDLREIVGLLREGPAQDGERPQPGLADLPELVQESRAAGARVTFDDAVPGDAEVPARIGRHAYRIVQEGLTNARKHAPGAHVSVRVARSAGARLVVEVANPLPPGPVTPPLPGAGAGLVGLRERVTLLDGSLEHGVTGDGRFVLHAELPVN